MLAEFVDQLRTTRGEVRAVDQRLAAAKRHAAESCSSIAPVGPAGWLRGEVLAFAEKRLDEEARKDRRRALFRAADELDEAVRCIGPLVDLLRAELAEEARGYRREGSAE